ncbi:hypothetical protein LUX12_00945 [Streptomyces somaliensis]|uniref:DUF6059 family protein n=1 Tax=Streptomyces somaliensis TaxID=78355 RepID=UPI0020CF333B|nr:DUF6059 family protein [Streptomyces somaliensis]MCP9943691.1 hypothetical protein [Streptomyces somaliensis]MCP9963062.1 hypothetical protein [Streptomyces somaliensis]MCP9975914.1 hypothetical protein [Streptomyces somaliensis]
MHTWWRSVWRCLPGRRAAAAEAKRAACQWGGDWFGAAQFHPEALVAHSWYVPPAPEPPESAAEDRVPPPRAAPLQSAPPPGSPERLRPDRPPTEAERALAREIWG